jgi:hypothetical protein
MRRLLETGRWKTRVAVDEAVDENKLPQEGISGNKAPGRDERWAGSYRGGAFRTMHSGSAGPPGSTSAAEG